MGVGEVLTAASQSPDRSGPEIMASVHAGGKRCVRWRNPAGFARDYRFS